MKLFYKRKIKRERDHSSIRYQKFSYFQCIEVFMEGFLVDSDIIFFYFMWNSEM